MRVCDLQNDNQVRVRRNGNRLVAVKMTNNFAKNMMGRGSIDGWH